MSALSIIGTIVIVIYCISLAYITVVGRLRQEGYE